MKYYNDFVMPGFLYKDLKKASTLLRKDYPNGPRIMTTTEPDRKYTYNEISSNIRPTILEISKSLY
jgi:hypothetical protein